MSKFSNACYVAAVATLLTVSCSTLRSNRNSSTDDLESTTNTLVSNHIDSLEVNLEGIDSLSLAVAQPIDSIGDGYNELDSLLTYELSKDEEVEDFYFEGAQTSSVVIDEYRNVVVEDMVIDLSLENSYYPADGHVTSVYGWRRSRMHAGIDLKAQTGDNLYAAFDGVVRLAKYYSSFGNCIIIRHYNGLETLYAHASKILVDVNDHVKAGDIIAYAGNTGRSTGSHLHFETRVAGHHFNPNLILDTDKRKIKDANLYIAMRNGRLFASNNDSEEEREAYILEQISIKYYVVRSGDNLSRIAANNGTTVATICRLNGISSKSILRIGQRLIVRDGIRTPAKAAASASTPASTKSSSSTSVSTANTTSYKIKNGDTLGKIAQNHGTTISHLCSLNGITPTTTIRAGKYLKVPGTGASSSQVQSQSTSSSTDSGQTTYYKVKSGDTLGKIAKNHGTSVSKLCSLNGISETSTLSIGQQLKISGSSSSTAAAAPAAPASGSEQAEYYYVKSGDTLSAIAEAHGTTVSALCSLNGISSRSTLSIKQRLRVK
ncbi:MAG: LysM peptidoglycan-binding domain-containing protein [Rikenellaceae bacterium]